MKRRLENGCQVATSKGSMQDMPVSRRSGSDHFADVAKLEEGPHGTNLVHLHSSEQRISWLRCAFAGLHLVALFCSCHAIVRCIVTVLCRKVVVLLHRLDLSVAANP